MMGFIVSASAVLLTAWIVYAATYRTAYFHGATDASKAWREQGHGDRCAELPVPAGTYCHSPLGCDEDCPGPAPHQRSYYYVDEAAFVLDDAARRAGEVYDNTGNPHG